MTPEHLNILWQYLESQCKPRKCAQPARVIGQALGLDVRQTMEWRHAVMVEHLKPIAAARDTANGPMGLYVPGSEAEAREYLRQLDRVLKQTWILRGSFKKAWRMYQHGPLRQIQKEIFDGDDGTAEADIAATRLSLAPGA